jgi:hypothetical protein
MQWALRWGLHPQAVDELRAILGASAPDETPVAGPFKSEAAVQQQVQLRAAARGARLWRNNVGCCEDRTGRMIRYGLANQTANINRVFKSSDLIGITPLVVTPPMLGSTVGVFTAAECKAPGWKYRDTDERAVAQLAFINFIVSRGGIARFVSNPEEF